MMMVAEAVKGKGSSLYIAPLTILDSGALQPQNNQDQSNKTKTNWPSPPEVNKGTWGI